MELVGTVVTAFGVAVLVVALVWVHLVPTGLNPLHDPVSQYGITTYRRWYGAAGLAAAIAAIGAVLLLSALFGPAAGVTSAFLAVFAVARAVIPFVPMDAPGEATTTRGRAHNLLAFAAFAAITVAAYLAGGVLHDGGLTEAATWSTILAIVMTIGSAGVLLSGAVAALGRLFGLVERLIYLGFIGWFIMIVAVGLG